MNDIIEAFIQDLLSRIFHVRELSGYEINYGNGVYSNGNGANVDIEKLISSYLKLSFDISKDFEKILYILEGMTPPKISRGSVNIEYENSIFCLFNLEALSYYISVKNSIRKIGKALRYKSGVAFFSEKIPSHLKRRIYIREKELDVVLLYKKAWNIHPLIPMYIFILHRITHNKTSGRNGGQLPEDLAKMIFKNLYKKFLEFLKKYKIENNLPNSWERAFKIFRKYEPEDLFLEYLNINKK